MLTYRLYGEKVRFVMDKMQMGIFTNVDKTIFDTVVILANQYDKTSNKTRVREAFNDYIDTLYDNGRISDNEHEFLELWFVWNQ